MLRSDPFTRSLLRRTDHLFAINDAFRDAVPNAIFTPPPLDLSQFAPDGPDVRAAYDIERKLVTVIGKLSKGRGFEDALQTFSMMRGAKLMIIGHGEHRPALEQLARTLGIADDVVWAGYHEEDLAAHYRAADLLLFTARGSDEGHRAVLEAMACGVPVATYPIEGVSALVPRDWIASAPTPDALAALATSMLARDAAPLRAAAAERAQEFGYDRAAERLMDEYSRRGDDLQLD